MKKVNRISALVILYNEEKMIKNCLDSFKEYVDEIIIIHDGNCKDKTLDICKDYDCRIYIRERVGEAEPHNPFGLEKCKYDWVIKIDADEMLSSELAKNLQFLVNNEKIDAYKFNWVAEINGARSNFLKKLILFRRNKMYCVGLPHVQCETRGTEENSDLVLKHESSEFNSKRKLLNKYIKKDKNWGILTAKMLYQDFQKIPTFNCDIYDPDIKQIKKIRFIKSLPYIAIFIFPFYSLFSCFIMKKGFKQGLLGFVLSTHVPLHTFFTCLYLSMYKIRLMRKSMS